MNICTESERDRRVLDNLGLAQSLARAYFRDDPSHDEDLVQVAYMGLVKAATRYRCDNGSSFAAFAVPTISGELKRHLRDHGWYVRPPRHIQEARHHLREAEGRLTQRLGRAPSVAELADDLGESEALVREVQCAAGDMRPVSLDAPAARDHETTLGDLIPDPGDALARADAALLLHAAVRRLPAQERVVLHLRFIEDRTQQDIATRLLQAGLSAGVPAAKHNEDTSTPVTVPACMGHMPPHYHYNYHFEEHSEGDHDEGHHGNGG